MLISYNWLKELLPDLNASPDEVAEALTKHSFETNIVRAISIDPKITISLIKQIEPHPNADRLRLATIATGNETVTVVCGAPNIKVGDTVPYAAPGATVYDEKGQSFLIKEAKIRGITSPGMLSSPRELGLGGMHDGIYILPSNLPLGTSLRELMPDDTVLEADITPNRAHDSLSHLGISRELAAIFNLTLKEPATIPDGFKSLAELWQLAIEPGGDTLRYRGLLFSHVLVEPSPLSIQGRLWALGARPINNIVDLTNYLMFESGIPSHAFDADTLPGKNIGVRRAKIGESLNGLDNALYLLDPEIAVITSDDQPVALAGIMGGKETQVTSDTTNVFLEIANFRAYPIQETSARLKISSEAASRHKKSISPANLDYAARRAVSLFQELSQAQLEGELQFYPHPAKEHTISFNPQRVSAIAGINIPDEEIEDILTWLRCKIKREKRDWQVTPPLDRLDLTGPHDLAEEVLRLAGHDRIPTQKPLATNQPALADAPAWREIVRDFLVSCGGYEVINYSFDDENIRRRLNLTENNANRIKLDNPPSPEQAYLRDKLYPRLISSALANKGELKRPSTKAERILFEIGTVFTVGGSGKVAGVIENDNLAVLFLGAESASERVQGFLNQLLELYGLNSQAEGDLEIINFPPGDFVRNKLGLNVTALEINLTSLARQAETAPYWQPSIQKSPVTYQAPGKYPASYRDLSLLVESGITVEQAQEIIERVGGKLVVDVDLFDIYSPGVSGGEAGGKQSLAFHIMYQSPDRTLTDTKVNALHQKITDQLQKELNATIR